MKSKSSVKKGFADGYKTYDTSNGYGNRNEWKESFYKRFTHQEANEILSRNEDDPLTILGVSYGASKEELRKAYREKVMFWHPDVNHSPEAEEMTKKIIAAYSLLT